MKNITKLFLTSSPSFNKYSYLFQVLVSVFLSIVFQIGLNQSENIPLAIFQIACLAGFTFGSIHIVKYAITKKALTHPTILLSVTITLFSLYWLPQGLDITDEGRILLIGSKLPDIEISNYMKERLGSVFFSWLWNGITGFNYILWSRLGYVLLTTSTAIVFYKWINIRFDYRIALLTSLLGYLSFTIFHIYAINYNTLPIFFAVLSVYFMDYKFKRKIFNPIFALGFMLLAGLCKVSFFAFILPIFFSYIAFPSNNINRRIAAINLLKIFAFVVLAFLLYTLITHKLLDILSGLNEYVNSKLEGLNSSNLIQHSLGGLLELYSDQIELIWPLVYKSFLICIGGLIMSLLRFKYSKIISGSLVLSSLFHLLDPLQFFWHSVISLTASLGMLSVLVGIVHKANLKWIFWAVLFYSFTFFGSNNGLQNIIYTGGILPLVSISLAILFNSNIKIKSYTFNPKPIAISLTILLAYFCIDRRAELIYRDSNRIKLTTGFESAQLIGIYSTPDRVKEIDGVLSYIEKNVAVTAKIAHINTIPMLAYLTGNPSNVHRECCNLPIANEADKTHDYYLVNTKNSRSWTWPKGNNAASYSDTLAYNSHLRIIKNHYSEVYSSNALKLFKNNNYK